MYICRLFRRDRPFEQIEARLIAEGSISLGRDPAADWQLDDPQQTLSRIHCTLSTDGDRLMLCDHSTNGTYFSNGERAPHDVAVPVEVRETLRLGGLSLLIDRPSNAELGEDADRTVVGLPLDVSPLSLPNAWQDASEQTPPPLHRDTPLLEAFCDGAGLMSPRWLVRNRQS
jgi:predicted component of type VI protein secretion system